MISTGWLLPWRGSLSHTQYPVQRGVFSVALDRLRLFLCLNRATALLMVLSHAFRLSVMVSKAREISLNLLQNRCSSIRWREVTKVSCSSVSSEFHRGSFKIMSAQDVEFMIESPHQSSPEE